MHQVKLHQTACMANRVKWIRFKLQVVVDFSARFGEKNWRLDIVKTFNDQLHLKTWYAVYFWKKNTFYMEKHRKINTMIARTTNGCRYSSHVVTVDIVPSRANPPRGANMLFARLPLAKYLFMLLCFSLLFWLFLLGRAMTRHFFDLPSPWGISTWAIQHYQLWCMNLLWVRNCYHIES